jgi:hypothetical protein
MSAHLQIKNGVPAGRPPRTVTRNIDRAEITSHFLSNSYCHAFLFSPPLFIIRQCPTWFQSNLNSSPSVRYSDHTPACSFKQNIEAASTVVLHPICVENPGASKSLGNVSHDPAMSLTSPLLYPSFIPPLVPRSEQTAVCQPISRARS